MKDKITYTNAGGGTVIWTETDGWRCLGRGTDRPRDEGTTAMAKKVTVTTTDGEAHELNVKPGEEAFYDDLPFNSSNVLITEIKE